MFFLLRRWLADSDFRGALGDGDQHDVHDADAAHQEPTDETATIKKESMVNATIGASARLDRDDEVIVLLQTNLAPDAHQFAYLLHHNLLIGRIVVGHRDMKVIQLG